MTTSTQVEPQPRTTQRRELVNFRPGAEFAPVLERFAAEWRVSRSIAAKRLAILGTCGFDPCLHHDALARLAELRGGTEAFALTCRDLAVIRDNYAAQYGGGLAPDAVLRILAATVQATEFSQPASLSLEEERGQET